MNEIVNKFLLAGDKFMSEIRLKQPGFTCTACGPFIKNKKRIQKLMQAGNANYIYGKNKDLTKRTDSGKFLRDKAFNIASNPKFDG